jgi:hypothetical protein
MCKCFVFIYLKDVIILFFQENQQLEEDNLELKSRLDEFQRLNSDLKSGDNIHLIPKQILTSTYVGNTAGS